MNRKIGVLLGLVIALSGCELFIPCNTDNSKDEPVLVKELICISTIEYLDNSAIRLVAERDCPVHFEDKNGKSIKSNVLHVSDIILISDEHYGSGSKILSIEANNILLEVNEGWSYPTSTRCSLGSSRGRIIVKPYVQ